MSVGTSLLIISTNSFVGFAGEVLSTQTVIDYKFLFLFVIFSVTGIFIGFRLASKISSPQLKKMFGWLVIVTGICVFIKEIFWL
jgi:uncharacterized membrane protein YfcA